MDETSPDHTKCSTAIHTEVLSAKMNTLTEHPFLSALEACQLAELDQTEPTERFCIVCHS